MLFHNPYKICSWMKSTDLADYSITTLFPNIWKCYLRKIMNTLRIMGSILLKPDWCIHKIWIIVRKKFAGNRTPVECLRVWICFGNFFRYNLVRVVKVVYYLNKYLVVNFIWNIAIFNSLISPTLYIFHPLLYLFFHFPFLPFLLLFLLFT